MVTILNNLTVEEITFLFLLFHQQHLKVQIQQKTLHKQLLVH